MRKILQSLRQKKISEYNLRKVQEELDVTEYREVLVRMLTKKTQSMREQDQYVVRQKLFKYGTSRGFESSILNDVLNELLPS